MTDVRVSNPNDTSIYDSLSFKTKKNAPQPKEEKVNTTITQDKSHIEKTEGNDNVKNVNFVEKKEEPVNSLPLINNKTGELLKFIVDEKGFPILDEKGQPQIDNVNGKPVYVKADAKGQPLLDESNNYQIVESTGKVPPTNVDLTSQPEKTPTENTQTPQVDSGKIAALKDPKTGELLTLKVDDKGQPVLDENGQLQPDPKGKHVYVKVDDKSQIMLNDKGEPTFVNADGQDAPPMPPEVSKAMNALSSHAAQRTLTGLLNKQMATSIVKSVSTKLVKGAHVGIPFTEKAIGFGVKHAVAKAVSAEIKSIKVVKAGGTTVVAALKSAEKTATVGAVKGLTEAGKLGKGVEVLTMKEAAAVFQKPATTIAGKMINKVNPVPVVQAVKQSIKAVDKAVVKEIAEKGVAQGAKTIVKNTVIGAGETVLKKGVTEGIEAGIKVVAKKEGAKIAEKVTTKAVEKTIAVTAEKAAVKAATVGTAKAGGKLASAVPIIGAVAGAAITVWDATDAYKKTVDPKVSGASTALAWTTVGLDVVSTVATATGVGTPIGWVATGLSIGTSILSDYLK